MIRTPPGWGADMLTQAVQSATAGRQRPLAIPSSAITIRKLRWALARGFGDFAASRTDVIFLCVV